MRQPLAVAIVGGLFLSPGADALHDAGLYLALDRFAKKHRRVDDLAPEIAV